MAKLNLDDYVTAHDAAQILSLRHGRQIKPDYPCKMLRMKKYSIRAVKRHDTWLYHKQDIQACHIGTRRDATLATV